MKLALVSRLAEPVLPGYNYASPVNYEVYWAAHELGKSHDVTVIRKGGAAPENCKSTEVKAGSEKAALDEYRDSLKDFDCVVDFSDEKWTTTVKENMQLSAVYVCHPTQGYQKPPPLRHPCLAGVSSTHASQLSLRFGVHVEPLPFGVPRGTNFGGGKERLDRLLFFGKITKERGAHEFVSLCNRRRILGTVAGDDVHVEQTYVQSILKQCDGKMVRYFGTVGEEAKMNMIAEAKALVIPYLDGEWAHSLLTVKTALAMGTPVVVLDTGSVSEFNMRIEFPAHLQQLGDFDFDSVGVLDYSTVATIYVDGTASRIEQLAKDAKDNPW